MAHMSKETATLENDPYEEPQEQNVRVFYKFKVNKDDT